MAPHRSRPLPEWNRGGPTKGGHVACSFVYFPIHSFLLEPKCSVGIDFVPGPKNKTGKVPTLSHSLSWWISSKQPTREDASEEEGQGPEGNQAESGTEELEKR